MNVLFVPFGSLNKPHFELELDILLGHKEKGDKITLVQCRGEMRYCYKNLRGSKDTCKYCVQRFDYAVKKLGLQGDVIPLPKVEVPPRVYQKEFKNIDELKNYFVDGFKQLGLGVGSKIVDLTKDHKPDTLKHKNLISHYLKSTYYAYEAVDKIVKALKPDLAYFFNGRSLDYRAVLQVMQNNAVQFYTHERGGGHDKYMLYPNEICQSLSLYEKLVPQLWANGGPEKEAIARNFFERRRAGKATSWKSFTKNQLKNKLPPGFDAAKKNITIFNSSIEEYVCIPDRGETLYPDDNQAIIKIARELAQKPGYFLYLRAHPHLNRKKRGTQMREIKQMAKLNIPNFKIIWPWEKVDTYALMDASDKIITFGSTAGVEAAYWGRPSILIGDSYSKNLDVQYTPKTHAELMALLTTDNLPPKPQINAIKCGYMNIQGGIKARYYTPESPYTGRFKGQYLIPPGRVWERVKYIFKKIRNKITGW